LTVATRCYRVSIVFTAFVIPTNGGISGAQCHQPVWCLVWRNPSACARVGLCRAPLRGVYTELVEVVSL